MRVCLLIIAFIVSGDLMAQRMPHGMVYGSKPSRVGLVQANKLEAFMGKRPRVSVSVAGRVAQVTNTKGGWFDVDAGNGKIITAHFKNNSINIPKSLKNRYIVMDGVAQRQMISDDHQHYAGGDSRGHSRPSGPRHLLSFEVKGLVVEK
ncbi:DUF4920 domain-containing protein [Mucilaginibacter boryungensis]|uniref:DUF4920 domain-containing protein n=1 Tax=Mucilaginibacter boryungensis TaxID=768480 RepID=A0ABR9XLY9_9SPHI|nr:DUF4920 domain-containing protein [Mucilaginibacter boryungensis]MBE9668074.1 DUF4920 domain-containing protein [Mucilaginibacter boryungensis]